MAFFTENAFISDATGATTPGHPNAKAMPTIDQLVSLFESLDVDMNGFLSAREVNLFLKCLRSLNKTGGSGQ